MGPVPRLLDLCSGAGGAAWGYAMAGFEVVGVDSAPQPRYPFAFLRADVFDVLADVGYVRGFDVIHVSPPCQAHSNAQRIQGREHPQLIPPLRAALRHSGLPYVIENVVGAPLEDPVELCGCMFEGLNVYRERLFESNVAIPAPAHRPHLEPLVKMGRPPRPGHRMHVVGHFSGISEARAAMGIGWMVREELREAIPPAYTEHVGAAVMAAVLARRAAA